MTAPSAPTSRGAGAVIVIEEETSAPRRRRPFPAWAGLVAAAAVLLVLVFATAQRKPETFTPITLDDGTGGSGLATSPSPIFLERYDPVAAPPIAGLPALEQEIPTLLPGQPAIYGPVATDAPVSIFTWLIVDRSEAPVYVVVDATSRTKVQSYEEAATIGGAPVRVLRSGGATRLEWDAGHFAISVVGFGIDSATLLELAAGIEAPTEPELAPSLSRLPDGFEVLSATSARSSSAGPGVQGWRVEYLVAGGDGSSLALTAATGRPVPLEELRAKAGPEHRASVRGQEALAFDYTAEAQTSRFTPRSQVLWIVDDVVFEARSAALSLEDLIFAVDFLDWAEY